MTTESLRHLTPPALPPDRSHGSLREAADLIFLVSIQSFCSFLARSNFPFLSLIGTEELLQAPDLQGTGIISIRGHLGFFAFLLQPVFLISPTALFHSPVKVSICTWCFFCYPQPLGLDPVSFWPSLLGQPGPMIYPGSILPFTFLSFGQSLFLCTGGHWSTVSLPHQLKPGIGWKVEDICNVLVFKLFNCKWLDNFRFSFMLSQFELEIYMDIRNYLNRGEDPHFPQTCPPSSTNTKMVNVIKYESIWRAPCNLVNQLML